VAWIPDALPVLALLAAALARIVPSSWLAGRVDVLLAVLVLLVAAEIDLHRFVRVRRRWRLVVAMSVLPLVVLALVAWALAQALHGATRTGVIALGLSPSEVASVGLVALIGGPAEVALAILAGSLALSALAGPPLLGALAGTAAQIDVLALVGRFALVVLVPLVVGVVARTLRPRIVPRERTLAALSSLAVVLLVYASLSGAGGSLGAPALGSAAFLAASALIAGLGVRGLRRARDRRLGLTIAMRDFAVAAALASAAAGPAAAHVAGIYGVLMLLAGATVAAVVRRRATQV
jgi:predicted Na+-dependent transporter